MKKKDMKVETVDKEEVKGRCKEGGGEKEGHEGGGGQGGELSCRRFKQGVWVEVAGKEVN